MEAVLSSSCLWLIKFISNNLGKVEKIVGLERMSLNKMT